MIVAQKNTVGLNTGQRGQFSGRDSSGGSKRVPPENPRPTLAEAGIDKKLSARAFARLLRMEGFLICN